MCPLALHLCVEVSLRAPQEIFEPQGQRRPERSGALCRIVFLNEAQAEQPTALTDPPEKLLLRTGGSLTARAYAAAQEGLRLYYHVVRGADRRAEIRGSGHREFSLGPDSLIPDEVANRIWRLHAAYSQLDDALSAGERLEPSQGQKNSSDRISLGA